MAAPMPAFRCAHIDALRDALKAAGKNCEIVVYPDAGHGFNADYRPSYRPAAAKDAWQHMLSWFKVAWCLKVERAGCRRRGTGGGCARETL